MYKSIHHGHVTTATTPRETKRTVSRLQSFDSMFEPICATKGWPAPVVEVRDEPDPDGLFRAKAYLETPERRFEAAGHATGWKGASVRVAMMTLLRQIDPGTSVPDVWLERHFIEPDAFKRLSAACLERGLGLPLGVSATPTLADFQHACQITIQALPGLHWISHGFSLGEARAQAATQALPVVMEMGGRIENPVKLNSFEDLRKSLFRAGDPRGWLLQLCGYMSWPPPSFDCRSNGETGFVARGTLTENGKPLHVTGTTRTTKAGAIRDAALLLLRAALPDVVFPLEVEVPRPTYQAKTRVIEYLKQMGKVMPTETVEVHEEELQRFTCRLYSEALHRSWVGRGYVVDEAIAMAFTVCAADLHPLSNGENGSKSAVTVANKAAAIRKPGANSAGGALVASPATAIGRVQEAYRATQIALPSNNPRIKVSTLLPGSDRWELRLDTGVILILSNTVRGCVELVGAKTRKGDALQIPERCRNRAISFAMGPAPFWLDLVEHFIRPIEQVNQISPKSAAKSAGPEIGATVSVSRLVVPDYRALPVARKEIEADPFVKSASGFFREGFQAFLDDEGSECPWAIESIRRVDWQLGYEYAALSCADCGARNSQGARCKFPEAPADEQVTSRPLHVLAREALVRLETSITAVEDRDLIGRALDLLEALSPPVKELDRPRAPALCLKCARLKERAKGKLCLNAGFALREIQTLEADHQLAPYRSVKIYGLRRTPKSPFWAYAVVTNGSILDCVDEDIKPYGDQGELIDQSQLTQAVIAPRQSRKL